jgi:hypothetical protein
MLTILLGPCIVLAPLIAVLALLALPLWPVAIVLLGLLWLLVWPMEHLALVLGLRDHAGVSDTLRRWFLNVLRPWVYFEERKRRLEREEGPPPP